MPTNPTNPTNPTKPTKPTKLRTRRLSFFYPSPEVGDCSSENKSNDGHRKSPAVANFLDIIDENLGLILWVERSDFNESADVRYNMYNAILSVIKSPERYSLGNIQDIVGVLDKMDIPKNTSCNAKKLLPTASMMQNTPFTFLIAQQLRVALVEIAKVKPAGAGFYS